MLDSRYNFFLWFTLRHLVFELYRALILQWSEKDKL